MSLLEQSIGQLESCSTQSQLVFKNILRDYQYGKNKKINEFSHLLDSELGRHIPELVEHNILILNCNMVRINPSIETCKSKIYSYLLRKYDTEEYLDENLESITIPRGALFEASLTIGSMERKLKLKFPDDEITDLLNKHNVNPCDKY